MYVINGEKGTKNLRLASESLFNLDKESGVAEEIFDFCKCLANCYNKAIENKSVEEDDVLQLISKKNNIVCALQDITLSIK